MSARTYTYLTRLAQALLVVALCGVLTTGLPAETKSYRPSDKDSGDSASERKAETKDAKDARNEKGAKDEKGDTKGDARRDRGGRSYRPDSSPAKPESSHDTATRQPGSWSNHSGNGSYTPGSGGSRPGYNDRGTSTYRSGGDSRGTGSYRPTGDARSNDRPDSTRSRYGDSRYRNDNRGYRPEAGNAASYKPRVHVYTRPSYGRDYSPPRSYKPPTYRDGSYHYSSHPNYRPCRYGYWVFENHDSNFCRRSIYYHYGAFPYLQSTRVYLTPYISVNYYDAPIVIDSGHYLSKHQFIGLDEALSDIRRAWVDGRSDLIENHVDNSEKIAVLLDGRYDYSVDADDYVSMTHDAIDETQTVSFTWESVRQRTDGDITAFGKHRYININGAQETVYVSYTLSKIGRGYMIVEVGSSSAPLR